MRLLYAFLIFLGIILLVLPISIPVIKTSAEFSMFNTNWNGCSEFAKLLAEKGKVIPLIYPYDSVKLSSLSGALIIIGPDLDFSQIEAEEVKKFLENGGILFIADDFGTANSLLEKLGVKARFSSQPLKDIFYSKRAEFPVVVRIDPSLNVEKITLNIPAVIMGDGGLAFSSKVSVIGKDMKSYPIMAEIKYGKGRIILLSDPSVLINDMFQVNKQFIENLIDYLGTDKFYFDEAHHSDFNPYSVTTVYIHKELDKSKAFQVFLAVAALAIFIESGIAGRIVRKLAQLIPREREDLLKDLPEWVDVRIAERIVNEIRTGSKLKSIKYKNIKIY